MPVKTGVYIQCEYCGKTIYKTLSQSNYFMNDNQLRLKDELIIPKQQIAC